MNNPRTVSTQGSTNQDLASVSQNTNTIAGPSAAAADVQSQIQEQLNLEHAPLPNI